MLTSKTAQASISQTSVFLHVLQLLHVQTQLQRTTWTDSDRLLVLFVLQWLQKVLQLLYEGVKETCFFSHLVCGLITGILQRKVHHSVLEGAAHVELQGDVVHTL